LCEFFLLYPPQTKFGGVYRNHPVLPSICPSVHPSMYLVSTNPPKRLIGFFMKLYTFVVHYLQMCMKEYGCCPKFKRGDNSTYTFTKREGACTLQVQLLLNCLFNFYETLHSCSTQPADVHEGIPLLSKI
jgi:hypothetical protein